MYCTVLFSSFTCRSGLLCSLMARETHLFFVSSYLHCVPYLLYYATPHIASQALYTHPYGQRAAGLWLLETQTKQSKPQTNKSMHAINTSVDIYPSPHFSPLSSFPPTITTTITDQPPPSPPGGMAYKPPGGGRPAPWATPQEEQAQVSEEEGVGGRRRA